MLRRHITALRLGLMAADAVTAVGLFFAVSIARFGSGWIGSWDRIGLDPVLLAAAYAAIWVVALWLTDLYRLRARWAARSELIDILRAALLVAVATFSALFVFKLPDVSRLFLVELFAIQVLVTFAAHLLTRLCLQVVRARGYSARFILVVGTGESARRFADRIERRRELGLRVIGHLAEAPGPDRVGNRLVLGTVDDIEDILHTRVVDEVAVCLDGIHLAYLAPIVRLCEEEGRIVRVPVEDGGLALPGGRIEDFDGLPVLSLVYGPDRILALVAKRAVDVVGAGLALIVLSPFLVAIAGLVALTEGRPIFFRQTRMGLHGRPFGLIKFRTMVPDAEARIAELEALNEVRGQAFKLSMDPRITPIGRWLRRTSTDELPQLWNVLIGSMSLVGPRPPLPREVAGYDVWHRRRLSMKPGITGLWQVSARREADFDRWVSLDLDYIDRWSLWLDLKIILRTIPAMLTGR